MRTKLAANLALPFENWTGIQMHLSTGYLVFGFRLYLFLRKNYDKFYFCFVRFFDSVAAQYSSKWFNSVARSGGFVSKVTCILTI